MNFRFISDVARFLEDDEVIEIVAGPDGRMLGFQSPTRRFYSVLMDGELPDLGPLVKDNSSVAVELEATDLISALRRAIVLSGPTPAVRIDFSAHRTIVRVAAEEGNIGTEIIDSVGNKDVSVSYNTKFLLEGVLSFGSGRIRIGLQEGIKPSYMTSAEPSSSSINHRYVVVPLRQDKGSV